MLVKQISQKKEVLYDNVQEFHSVYPDTVVNDDWRLADEGDWVVTDDDKVCRILKKSQMKSNGGKDIDYVRTILGTYTVKPSVCMSGVPPKNIYSFSNKKFAKELRHKREKPTNKEFLFAKYVAKGMSPTDAYLRVFSTKNKEYAKETSRGLLKTERIQKLVEEEIEVILSEIGASKQYLLEMTKGIIDNYDGKDSDKLRAIELMMKIAGMFPNEKKTESLTVFQGFTKEQLDKIGSNDVKMLAHAEKQVDD
jgi:hypothetical protein